MSRNPDAEAALEGETMRFFSEALAWDEVADCYSEIFGEDGTLGRKSDAEVLLLKRVRAALCAINPDIPAEGIEQAVEQLTAEWGLMSLVQANRAVYTLLKEGAKVTVLRDGEERTETVRFIDWDNADANDFFLASQLWVSGEYGRKRMDLVGFVNGLPLVLIELKASHRRVENAYRLNLSDYKTTIPHLFHFNAFIILSNGRDSRVGTVTSSWAHFAEWKRINSEGETGVISLETMLRGTCDKARLLDLLENFILFSEEPSGVIKILAKNHQYLGVNNAIEALEDVKANDGRLGVFWHTQGSGKSYSMVFFSQKILRKVPGNWSFLVVTDRVELDEQIYGTFVSTGAVTKDNVQAGSGEHLQELLQTDNRYVFSLIQKFRVERGETYPTLSTRDDIIVMTDEAHRSQYDIYAKNMRDALPNAAFIGFTGTPLMAGEERTREVFGDYVSVYNFRDAIQDGATVPLYYENRIPEVQLVNDTLNEDMGELLDEVMLDEAQQAKLEREFGREYHLITRDDRLDKVAEDIVSHFMGRGQFGKAMVVSIDKATAVKMYDRVQEAWLRYLDSLEVQHRSASGDEQTRLAGRIQFMQDTDMAVVVSQSQNEIEEFKKKGLDIATHRKRMVSEALDERFKDSSDALRIVFVCAMWMTGFDAPSVSTLYLDKPMKNHTLMQTIARANRVWGEKNNGLIVDYIGVFRNLQKALAVYGTGERGASGEGDMPIKPKDALLAELSVTTDEAVSFLEGVGVDVDALVTARGFDRVAKLEDATEQLLVNDDTKRQFLVLARKVDRLYKATLPSGLADEFAPVRAALVTLLGHLESTLPQTDISEVMGEVEALLDLSVAAEAYIIPEPAGGVSLVDLSQVDFEALKQRFETGRKRTEAEKLRGQVNAKVMRLARLNKGRMDYVEKLQSLIADYNEGSANVDVFFTQLVDFAQALNEEEQRAVAEGLDEETLAVFDLLVRPDVELSESDTKVLKAVAKELLGKLKWEKLVLDWRKGQQSKAAVRVTIEETLDKLPSSYEQDVWQATCDATFEHVYQAYPGAGQSIYTGTTVN